MKWIVLIAIFGLVLIAMDEMSYYLWKRSNPGLLYHQTFITKEGDRTWAQAYHQTGRLPNVSR